MDNMIMQFVCLVEREAEAYSTLLDLSQKEQDAIIRNNVSEVESISSKEKTVLKTLKNIERERISLFSLFSEKSGILSPCFNDIADKAAPEAHKKLMTLSATINIAIKNLRRVNELNKKLIASQIKYTSFCLSLVAGISGRMETYSNSGRVNENNTASYSLLDQII